jgi:hypothetical protein
MADCIVTPFVAQQIAAKDLNRLQGAIAKALAYNSPFVNVLNGGVLPAGVSDTVRSIVQEQALPGDSLVRPTFVATKDLCGPVDSAEGVATTEYTYSLGTKRGRGPKICVKGAYAAYKGSYLMAEDSLKKLMTQYYNTDIRATLLDRSGVKYVAGNSGTISFEDSLTGGEQQIDVDFANVGADNIGQLNFKALSKLSRFMHEVLLIERFDEASPNAHYRFIGGSDIIEAFRNETNSNGTNINETLRAIAAGGFQYGKETLTGYQWASDIPFRGIQFGVDQRPLRATELDEDGQPVFVEPFVGVATTTGTAARVNPDWKTATYEVAFLIGKDSFERLVPERFTGEGSFKFSPQLAMGELQWHYVIDNDCNQYGDFGWHKYEITRAYRPIRPHAVVPILFRRCPYDTGIVTCPDSGSIL